MSCIISAPSSNSGKTLLSLVLTAWARSRNISIQPFKIGPDYLDSQYLSLISGRECRNLDLILSNKKLVRESFENFRTTAELSLIEGVMGLFDGIGATEEGSTASVAKFLNLPVVLVIDSCGQAASLAALVNGFKKHDPQIHIAGVVLNKISTNRHKELLKEVLSQIGTKFLGSLPKDPFLSLPSKNLGLTPARQINDIKVRMELWASIAEKSLDIKSFQKLLETPLSSKNTKNSFYFLKKENSNLSPCPIAVAKDSAFHFLYPETKDCLESLNMPVINWSPLNDEHFPKEAKGLIIPGGFPEEYAEELENCKKSLNDIRNIFGKLPIYAECGGMLLLGKSLATHNNKVYSMAGILPIHARKGPLKVGYRKTKGLGNSFIINKSEEFIGHEFHRWEIEIEMNKLNLKNKIKPAWEIQGWNIKKFQEGWSNKKLHASWIHLNWASNLNIVERFRNATFS